MTATEVISLYTQLESLNIKIWVDGGWCVDALMGEQARPHKDLDIAIQLRDVPRLRQLLYEQRYREIKLQEARPWNFVLGDDYGREIDIHGIVLDDQGNGVYGPPGAQWRAECLSGHMSEMSHGSKDVRRNTDKRFQ